MTITLRAARSSDQTIIRRMVFDNNLNPFDLAWRNFVVATDVKDCVIGCGQIKTHGELQELASLVVAEGYQGQGISYLLMEHLLASSARPLWLICESPLTSYYERFGFIEVKDQSAMPPYFQSARWFTRIAMDWFLALRGSYIAYMVLNAGVTSPQGAGDAS